MDFSIVANATKQYIDGYLDHQQLVEVLQELTVQQVKSWGSLEAAATWRIVEGLCHQRIGVEGLQLILSEYDELVHATYRFSTPMLAFIETLKRFVRGEISVRELSNRTADAVQSGIGGIDDLSFLNTLLGFVAAIRAITEDEKALREIVRLTLDSYNITA
jgi:hypothetical protein